MPDKITEEKARILIEDVRERKLGQLEITDYILSKAVEKLKTLHNYVGTLVKDIQKPWDRQTIELNYYELYNNKEKIIEELEDIAKIKLNKKQISEDDYHKIRIGLGTIYEISRYMIGVIELIPGRNIDYILDELFITYKRFSLDPSYYTNIFAKVFGQYTLELNKASAIIYLAPEIYKLFAIEFIKLYTGYKEKQ